MLDYKVRHGDSPAAIARRYGVSVTSLVGANPQKHTTVVAGQQTWRSLHIGEVVRVPSARVGLAGQTSVDVGASPIGSKTPTITAFITNSDQATIGGDVQFFVDGNFVGAASVIPQGGGSSTASVTLADELSPGNHTFDAAYSGDPSNDAGRGSVTFSVAGGGGGGGGGRYSSTIVAAAQALDAQLVAKGCCGCGDAASALSAVVMAFKRSILTNPSQWGVPGIGNAATVTGSTIDVSNDQCQHAFGNGTINDLRAVLGSGMRYSGGPCATWNGAGNCPCTNTGSNCGQQPPSQTFPCPAGTVKEGQQVANILTDCGGPKQPPRGCSTNNPCPSGQQCQSGQCITPPSSGGGGGSAGALLAGVLLVGGGIAATTIAMKRKKRHP